MQLTTFFKQAQEWIFENKDERYNRTVCWPVLEPKSF